MKIIERNFTTNILLYEALKKINSLPEFKWIHFQGDQIIIVLLFKDGGCLVFSIAPLLSAVLTLTHTQLQSLQTYPLPSTAVTYIAS